MTRRYVCVLRKVGGLCFHRSKQSVRAGAPPERRIPFEALVAARHAVGLDFYDGVIEVRRASVAWMRHSSRRHLGDILTGAPRGRRVRTAARRFPKPRVPLFALGAQRVYAAGKRRVGVRVCEIRVAADPTRTAIAVCRVLLPPTRSASCHYYVSSSSRASCVKLA